MRIDDARGIVRRRLDRAIADFMHARRKGWSHDTIREYAGYVAGVALIANLIGVVSDAKHDAIMKFVYQGAYTLRFSMRQRAMQKAGAA